MTEERIQPRPYLKLLLLAAIVGFLSAAVTFAFMWLVHGATGLLWEPAEGTGEVWRPILTVVICAVGGLVVGALVRVFGDHTGVFAEIMADFGRTGRFNYRRAPGMVVTAFVSLAAGGSMGPEAPMADASGGIGTYLADKLKMDERSTRSLGFSGISGMLGAFVTSPFSGALLGLESARAGISVPWVLFPSLVSSAVATVTFVLFSGAFFGNLYVFPEYMPRLTDLLLAVPLGLVGALAGGLFIILFHRLRSLMQPLRRHLILRGLIGGIGLGVVGALWPLTLFSGEEETLTLIETAAELGVITLIVLAVAKLIVTSLLLSTGWKGGYIFPTMFAGVALGLAVHLVFPSIPIAVSVSATMAGAMVATMKAPLFSALFTAMLVQREAAPVIAIAVIVALLATARLSMVTPRPQQENATEPEAIERPPSGSDQPSPPG